MEGNSRIPTHLSHGTAQVVQQLPPSPLLPLQLVLCARKLRSQVRRLLLRARQHARVAAGWGEGVKGSSTQQQKARRAQVARRVGYASSCRRATWKASKRGSGRCAKMADKRLCRAPRNACCHDGEK